MAAHVVRGTHDDHNINLKKNNHIIVIYVYGLSMKNDITMRYPLVVRRSTGREDGWVWYYSQ